MSSVDLTEFKVIAAQDIVAAAKGGAKTVVLRKDAVITPSARETAASAGITLSLTGAATAAGNAAGGGPAPANSKWEALLNSPEAQKIKEEICAVGRKLWQRQFVDGNGGNIS